AVDSTLIELSFTEALDSTGTHNLSDFPGSNGAESREIIAGLDPFRLWMALANPLKSGTYTVSCMITRDRYGNWTTAIDSVSFTYIEPYRAKPGDVLINEIFADPAPQIALPSVEFIELFNTSDQPVALKNWTFADRSNASVLGDHIIQPHSFLILCAKSDTSEYKRFAQTV